MTPQTSLRTGLLALALLGAPTVVHALEGTMAFTGGSRLRPRGCGVYRAEFSGTLIVANDGTWGARLTGEDALSGTYTDVGKSGRRIRLAFDEPSLAAIAAAVEEDVPVVCESPPATVTSTRLRAAKLTIDRSLTTAKLVVHFLFKGNTGGRTGTASYQVRAGGSWTPA